jgi:hypothetical protein
MKTVEDDLRSLLRALCQDSVRKMHPIAMTFSHAPSESHGLLLALPDENMRGFIIRLDRLPLADELEEMESVFQSLTLQDCWNVCLGLEKNILDICLKTGTGKG